MWLNPNQMALGFCKDSFIIGSVLYWKEQKKIFFLYFINGLGLKKEFEIIYLKFVALEVPVMI